VLWETFIGSLKNSLRKWFYKEPWFERFIEEPDMVLLWHHSEEPFPVPKGTSMFPCVVSSSRLRLVPDDRLEVRMWIRTCGRSASSFLNHTRMLTRRPSREKHTKHPAAAVWSSNPVNNPKPCLIPASRPPRGRNLHYPQNTDGLLRIVLSNVSLESSRPCGRRKNYRGQSWAW